MYQAMIFLLIVILFLFGYLSVFNGKEIELFLSRTTSIHTTASAIVIASFILGMLLMAVVSLLREAGRRYRDWQRKNLLNSRNLSASLVEKGDFELVKGDVEKAKEYYRESISKNQTNLVAHIKLAECYIASNDNSDAIKMLIKVKYQDPENVRLLIALRRAYALTGDATGAIDVAKKLVSLEEENPMFLALLRDAYVTAAMHEEAYRTQKNIMKIARGKEDYKRERERLGELKYWYAVSILKKGDPDLALKKFGDVKKLNPGFVPSYVTIGDTYLDDRHDMEKALEEWKSGYAMTHNGVFLIRMEDVYIKHDNPFELIRFYRSLLTDAPDDILTRIMFAKLMLRLEMVDDAAEQLAYLDNKWVRLPSTEVLNAELLARRGDYAAAYKRIRDVQITGALLKFPYVCSSCGYETYTWAAACQRCNAANSFTLKTSKEIDLFNASQTPQTRNTSLPV